MAKFIISYLAGCRFLQPLQPFPFGRRALMVAVGPNMVWAVDTSEDIFKLNGGQWQHIGVKLKGISVGVSHVWGVSRDDKTRDDKGFRNRTGKLAKCGWSTETGMCLA